MKKEVDALAEIESAEIAGPSKIGKRNRPSPPGAKAFMLTGIFIIILICGFFSYKAFQKKQDRAESNPTVAPEKVQQVIPAIEPPPRTPPVKLADDTPPIVAIAPTSVSPSRQPSAAQPQPQGPTQDDLLRVRRFSAPLTAGSGRALNQQTYRVGASEEQDHERGELEQNLQPIPLSGSRAAAMSNRDMTITRGAMLDCVLATRMVTTQPGMVSCYLTRDIYSTSGRVILLDRGSLVTGHYQGGLTQGQARIFVTWTRIETPKGIIINIDSPATGPLGESGVDGYIDTHFWQRFGGALLISLVGDFGDWAASEASSGSNNNVNISGTSNSVQDAVTEALRNSINIPPTLYKNQGERVAIFVARDLDFSGVYQLEVSNK